MKTKELTATKKYYYEAYADVSKWNGVATLKEIVKELCQDMDIHFSEVIDWIKSDSKKHVIENLRENSYPFIKYRLDGEQHGMMIFETGVFI